MPHAFAKNVNGHPANALAAHLRNATHSRVIPRTHRIATPGPQTRRLPVAGGNAGGMFGIGDAAIIDTSRNVGTPIPAEHVERLALPLANAIPRTRGRSLSIPISHRLPAPQYQQLPKPQHGAAFPGIGEWFLGETNFDDLAGQTTLVRAQKPRTMGNVLPTYHDFIPGLGEEADGDIYAEGYLTANDLAADAVPTSAPMQAATSTKMPLLITAVVAAGIFFLLKR